MSLDGKVIVVVGASGLLGRAIVLELLEQGAAVVAADICLSSLENAFHSVDKDRITFCEGDITRENSIHSVFLAAESKFGKLDGAVNAAYPRNKNYGRKYFDVTYDDFCENVSLHLGGYFLFTQQCAEFSLKKGSEFSLVNISSIYGVTAPRFEVYENTEMTMPVEYAAIKSALIHLDKYVTAFMKNTNFRLNSVSPGGIYAGQPESFVAAYKARCQKKGLLDTSDVCGSVVFLLSEQSRYVCGQNVCVDDGFQN